MPRDLVYLVAIGAVEPRFLQSVEWCVTSLRRWGRYPAEVAVITDQPPAGLPAAVRAEATLVRVAEDQLCDPHHARPPYERYLIARLRAHHLLDLRVFHADEDGRVPFPQEPAGAGEHGRVDALFRKGVDQTAGILLLHDGQDELQVPHP